MHTITAPNLVTATAATAAAPAWADHARAPRPWPFRAAPGFGGRERATAAGVAGAAGVGGLHDGRDHAVAAAGATAKGAPTDFVDETAWVDLDDAADAAALSADADRADAQLLGAVACAAFATLALALVSSLPLAQTWLTA